MAAADPLGAYRAAAAAKHAAWTASQSKTTSESNPKAAPIAAVSTPTLIPTLTKVSESANGGCVGVQYIYVLLCSGGKYYVGESYNVEDRFAQHLDGKSGAAWTRKYEPIEVIRKFVKQTVHDEDNTTLDYMVEHGIRNVRGGSFCSVHLPRHIRRTIKQRLATIKKLCYRCKQPGHCANNCPASVTAVRRSWIDCDSEEDEKEIVTTTSPSPQAVLPNPLFSFDPSQDETSRAPMPQSSPERLFDFDPSPQRPVHYRRPILPSRQTIHQTIIVCSRCGRNNHSDIQCFAKHHLHGHLLPSK